MRICLIWFSFVVNKWRGIDKWSYASMYLFVYLFVDDIVFRWEFCLEDLIDFFVSGCFWLLLFNWEFYMCVCVCVCERERERERERVKTCAWTYAHVYMNMRINRCMVLWQVKELKFTKKELVYLLTYMELVNRYICITTYSKNMRIRKFKKAYSYLQIR